MAHNPLIDNITLCVCAKAVHGDALTLHPHSASAPEKAWLSMVKSAATAEKSTA
jgi:hypothetical protein